MEDVQSLIDGGCPVQNENASFTKELHKVKEARELYDVLLRFA